MSPSMDFDLVTGTTLSYLGLFTSMLIPVLNTCLCFSSLKLPVAVQLLIVYAVTCPPIAAVIRRSCTSTMGKRSKLPFYLLSYTDGFIESAESFFAAAFRMRPSDRTRNKEGWASSAKVVRSDELQCMCMQVAVSGRWTSSCPLLCRIVWNAEYFVIVLVSRLMVVEDTTK
jgi:hypothetical protein